MVSEAFNPPWWGGCGGAAGIMAQEACGTYQVHNMVDQKAESEAKGNISPGASDYLPKSLQLFSNGVTSWGPSVQNMSL